jgi:tetratricopeptide (TPR) repeat protein
MRPSDRFEEEIPKMRRAKVRFAIVFLLLFLVAVRVVAAGPEEEAMSHFDKGMEFNKERRFNEARGELVQAMELSLETYKYHQALVLNYLEMRQGLKAIAFYRDLSRAHPDSSMVHYWLGRLYLVSGNLNDSATEFKESSRLAPKDEHPLISLGHVYYRLGKDREALDAYLEANRLSPKVASVHEGLGNIYFNRKEYAKAMPEYEEALRLDESLSEARFRLSIAYEKEGEIAKAVKEWRTLLDDDPNESRARERLARAYFLGEQYKDAVEQYTLLSEVRQSSPEVFLALGESEIMLATQIDDPDRRASLLKGAKEAFQRTIELDPKNAQAKKYLEDLKSKAPPKKPH